MQIFRVRLGCGGGVFWGGGGAMIGIMIKNCFLQTYDLS